ncbi:MAG: phytanoyl-CoA dioxygenase family protein [Bdellovibrionales bacterium]|nr:phytanoyl-CoA dioxygenase family protein [Bdellovibrionales bacterium]
MTFQVQSRFSESEKLSVLQAEFHRCFEDQELKSPFANVRHFDATSIVHYKAFDLLRQKVEQTIKTETDYRVSFRKLWLVNTDPTDSDQTKLPYIPHFDKERYLKAMIYLTDVIDTQDGPIHLLDQEIQGTDQRRRKLPKNHKERGLNHFRLNENQTLQPIPGAAGTLILFDTNTPHKAGLVSPGHNRKVLRFDFEDPEWNRKSLLRKVIDRIM